MNWAIEAVAIIAFCVATTCTYGVLHDQITVRLCLEYFTVGHNPVFGSHPATILAIIWGVAATWWVALFFGTMLAFVSTFGSAPALSWRSIVRPVLILLATMAVSATTAGLIGYFLASSGTLKLNPYFSQRIPSPHRAFFVADAFAHDASYAVGIIGALVVLVKIKNKRKRQKG